MTSTMRARSASFGTLVAAALTPKCPLCVAALLSTLGVGTASAAHIAPFVRPVTFLLAAATVLALAWGEWRRFGRRREQLADCCAHLRRAG